MSERASRLAVIWSGLFCLTNISTALAAPLSSNRDINVAVSNDAGALYGVTPDSYFIDASGGGLNQLHISTDGTPAGVSGQVTAENISTSSMAGTFFVTTTGGRGYNDDIILLFSIVGPISN